ncbi:hypothetical protein W02_36920 [Nitrospira sp. KM1]|uniref:FecR family protein n=1 Tax=Nitrospira sp. KM1 TaxID=1936990 RepID=UPI0013A78F7D|nr:FecR family protein [Nitrospira sp. KM1]BCA56552.1 hypothetical protein W02_36920 [Nitrospira sp. KM1]
MIGSLSMTLFGKLGKVRMTPSDTNQNGGAKLDQRLMREATEWFMRQSASDFSMDQRARLEAWRRTSAAHDRAYKKVAALWEAPEMTLAAKRVAGTAVPADIARISRSGRWKQQRIAAVAATVLLLSLALWSSDLLTWWKADYATAVGERRVVTLTDQSTVTLNTDSAIAVRYEAGRRLIRLLHGEASFAVQPDAARPFTVETHGVTATALGTEFLIRDRQDDVQVTVLHGSVQVDDSRTSAASPVRLVSGDQVTVGPQGPGAVVQVDAASQVAWLQGRLVFVRAPLAEVVRELSRYHRGYVAVWNSSLDSLPVTGIYNLNDPARVITTLADTLPIHLVRLTDHVIVIR